VTTSLRYRYRLVRCLLPIVALLAALAASASSVATTKPIPLKGSVGPDFVISLKTAKGKPVKRLKAGKYAITVTDKSSAHMFHLIGPGLNKIITGLDFQGKKTVIVKLKAGKKYIYQCDPHKSTMKGSFLVTG
jgi:hypothetical protein